MTPQDLPAPDCRMSPGRKARIVDAVQQGDLSPAEACARYAMAPEELAAWALAKARHGANGLRLTRLHAYHPARKRHCA